MTQIKPVALGVLLTLLSWPAAPARGIIVIGPGDTGNGQNQTPPGTAFPHQGWDYEGAWVAGGSGTAIAPNYFISAAHLSAALNGGGVGYQFVYQGQTYTTTAAFDIANSDLKVFRVDQPMPNYAPLYSGTDEVGKSLVTFGHGTQKGPEVTLNGETRGWSWGGTNFQLSWGYNSVGFAGPIPQLGPDNYLTFDFSNTSPNNAIYSVYDSGGGLFIQASNGTWQLAGVNYAVDSQVYRKNPDGSFALVNQVALFDARGFYVQTGPNTYAEIAGTDPVPFTSYASRISTHYAEIQAILSMPIPEPGSLVLLAIGVAGGLALTRGRLGRRAGG